MLKVLLNIFKGRRTLPWALFDGLILMFNPFQLHGNTVLVIKLEQIGDFVLWLDAAKSLINHYRTQGRTVVLIGDKSWAGWAEEMKLADEVWGIDTQRFIRNLPYRWKWLRRVRNAGFEIVIQPTFSRMFLSGDSLVRASNALECFGSEGDLSNIHPWFRHWSNHWYTRLISAANKPLMELQRNVEFMRGFGFTDFQVKIPEINRHIVGRSSLSPQEPYAVIFPSASWAGRAWPVENFAKIARRLKEVSMHVVVAGGPADHAVATYLLDLLPANIVNLVGKTSLADLAELLRTAEIVITNETSAVHIGAAVGAPVVCILGGGHYGRFVPYDIDDQDDTELPIIVAQHMPCFGCNWNCIYPRTKTDPVKCIRDISVNAVWYKIESVLRKENCLGTLPK